MKESIGGVSLFTIVIVFIVLFTGYISLSINYSKAYNVKNELIIIIKNQGGVCVDSTDPNSICKNFPDLITSFFNETNYRGKGNCGEGYVGFSRNGDLISDGRGAAFCVKGVNVSESSLNLPKSTYYEIRVFWQLDLPIFSSIFNFAVKGETPVIMNPSECKDDENGVDFDWCAT